MATLGWRTSHNCRVLVSQGHAFRAIARAACAACVLLGCGDSAVPDAQAAAASGDSPVATPAMNGPMDAVGRISQATPQSGARSVSATAGIAAPVTAVSSGGAGAASALTAGQAGTAGAGGATIAGAAGTQADAGARAAGSPAMTGAGAGPTLPTISDPSKRGPLDFQFVDTASGLTSHSLFVPSKTDSEGKHPVVVWQCGNGASIGFYMTFLEHLASHGFFVVANKVSSSDRTAEAASESQAVDWVVSENDRSDGEYIGKLDVEHIAVMGHSLGSLTSFETAASNPHVATSIHFSGGLTGNPVGFDMKWLASMTKPAAFLCGADDTAAGPACEQDFAQAPAMLPVFYGVLANADHIGPFLDVPNGGDYGTAAIAWLRWQLAGDATFKTWFSGASCELCSAPWTAKQRNLD